MTESVTSRRRALTRSASHPPASDESTPAALAAPSTIATSCGASPTMSVKYSTVTVRKMPRPTRLISVAITRMRSTGSATDAASRRRRLGRESASSGSMTGTASVSGEGDDGAVGAGLTDPVLPDPDRRRNRCSVVLHVEVPADRGRRRQRALRHLAALRAGTLTARHQGARPVPAPARLAAAHRGGANPTRHADPHGPHRRADVDAGLPEPASDVAVDPARRGARDARRDSRRRVPCGSRSGPRSGARGVRGVHERRRCGGSSAPCSSSGTRASNRTGRGCARCSRRTWSTGVGRSPSRGSRRCSTGSRRASSTTTAWCRCGSRTPTTAPRRSTATGSPSCRRCSRGARPRRSATVRR